MANRRNFIKSSPGILRRSRRHRLNYIAILPSLVTLINGLCGFAAIGFAGSTDPHSTHLSNFALAGYFIFIGMIADMLDGRLARMSHTTSSFGGQLDSLCDIITFGVAPAFLVFKLLYLKLTDLVNPPMFF